MNKVLRNIALINSVIAGSGGYDYGLSGIKFHTGGSSKTYENKNANIEYYEDEKGNIRRRKIK